VSSAPHPALLLDLRGTPCPLNFIRARLALEGLEPGSWLQLDLDRGEAEEQVSSGLRQQGHAVQEAPHPEAEQGAIRLLVCRHGA
jgi:TusA-related sulfurtransferase